MLLQRRNSILEKIVMLTNYMFWLAILFNVLTNIGFFKYASMVEKKSTTLLVNFYWKSVFGF